MTQSNAPIVVLLEGDGVGPEVVREAAKVLKAVAPQIVYKNELIGGSAIDATGVPLPAQTVQSCKSAAAILLGAVGEQGLLEIRKELDLYANIRPCVFPSEALLHYSPLKLETVKGAEFTVIRELTGGIYFGERQEEEIQRITRIAGHLAMLTTPPQHVTSIDKANVLASSRLWRRVVTETLTKEFPSVPFSHQLVDSAAMIMNMFGDILSDEASVIPGSLGLLPSASLNGVPGEGANVVDCTSQSTVCSRHCWSRNCKPNWYNFVCCYVVRYSLGMEKEAKAIEDAVRKVLDEPAQGGRGLRTKDLGGMQPLPRLVMRRC
ncbi:3-isopropylmalate dehydrogenase [Rhizoclosmatium globosum]|uniref:3-isopropylmalate dehydrogenase n=1 Tax=Rhizoclosmatium globosum TaxID=329046 RepID=A0A1Y2CPM8_9FUNG|nr:3-isopropylmalate dehydrogenase [Rhizoclosmatium globosum]|eukprot:ORY48927.1 3-isopropylmalate dehydrogenase [Rhizoclosmatium globosum]